jgi:hypothetical protein
MPSTPALDLQSGRMNNAATPSLGNDFERMTSTQLAQLHRENRNNLVLLCGIEAALATTGRKKPVSINTLELVRQDIDRLRKLQAEPPALEDPVSDPRALSPTATPHALLPEISVRRRRRSWASISAATVFAAIVIGFAQGLGGQLWASVWPAVAIHVKLFATFFGGQ